jgi:hypothetical protein
MLFKGVVESELSQWENACMRAKAADGDGTAGRSSWEVDWWQDIVGVDIERALDTRLYRVLEWGGMEVLPLGWKIEPEVEAQGD